jgi:hypothetical protein
MRTCVRMGNAGSDLGRLRTALKTGSYKLAVGIARDLPRVSLADALTLTLMSLTREPERYEVLARRWLAKFIAEAKPNLEEIVYAAELLRDLEPDCERSVMDAIRPML